MTTTTIKTARALRMTEERNRGGSEFYHLAGRICESRYEHGQRQPTGLDDEYEQGLYLSHLRVSCQGDDRSRGRQGEPVYAFDVEYRDVFCVDQRRATRMAKTLDKIAKGLAKLHATRGYVRSFGEFVGRVCEVLGLSEIVMEQDQRIAHYSGQRWRWMSVGDGVNAINQRIAVWVNEGKPAQEPEAQVPTAEEQAS